MTPHEPQLLQAPERVLTTLNQDGTRRRIRPRLSPGRYQRARRGLAWFLMALFVGLPHLSIGGKPPILLDIVAREFTLLGTTFGPTDTPLLMLLLLTIFVGIFLATALLGRVWCGWGCPQTVYMEFLFRPLERLFEGSPQEQARRDREGPDLRRALKNVVFVLVAFVVANSFLAYFVGAEQLLRWMRGSPFEHPTAFAVMALVTAAMYFDFGFFREQTCQVVCPYGRFQSALLDRDSLIVAYDPLRGEPRGKVRRKLPVVADAPPRGDCVDCGACVITCPTGLDIRDGLQMECIACTQCIDACDAIMDRLGRPRGLIRYSSQAGILGEPRRLLRPRVAIYSLALVGLLAALASGLALRAPARVSLLRARVPFVVLDDGRLQNQLRWKVENRGEVVREYRIGLADPSLPITLIPAPHPLPVAPGRPAEASLVVLFPPRLLAGGERAIELVVSDDAGFRTTVTARLLGPGGE